MSKVQIDLENQLNENISIHQSILGMSKDIIAVIKNIERRKSY